MLAEKRFLLVNKRRARREREKFKAGKTLKNTGDHEHENIGMDRGPVFRVGLDICGQNLRRVQRPFQSAEG
jgi:hypothetical protein